MNILKIFLLILHCISREIIKANQAFLQISNVLKQETKINQLLLLYDDDYISSEILQISKNISKTIPTHVADFTKITKLKKENLQRSGYLVQTTTIVVISGKNNVQNSSKLLNVLKSIAKLSFPKARPTILIFTQVSRNTRYERFLKLLWNKKFLNVAILELKMQKKCKMLTQCVESKIVKLHDYNPFTERYSKRNFLSNRNLFPNKLHNMYGYNMSVYLFHYPPYVYINRNSTGHVVNVHGPDINLMFFFSKAMNFTVEKMIYNNTNWLLPSYTYKMLDDILNKLQFAAIQTAMTKTALTNFIQFSKGTRMINYVFLVPILPNERPLMITEWNLMKIVSIICFFLMPWLIGKLLNFDKRYWKLMYGIQMILGISIPKEPRKIKEKIVFLTLLAVIFMDSYIFTAFSSLQLEKQILKKLETLDDLLALNLTTVIHGSGQIINNTDDNDTYHLLMKNAIFSEESLDKCVEILINYQNVTCNGREESARLIIQNLRNTTKLSKIKILKQADSVWPSGLFITGGSAYSSQFEPITEALIESGISQKWYDDYIPKASQQQSYVDLFIKHEISLTFKCLNLLIAFLLIGYTCSYLVFTAEIILHKCLN